MKLALVAVALVPLSAAAQPIVPAAPPLPRPSYVVREPADAEAPEPERPERFYVTFSAGVAGPLGSSSLPFGLSQGPGVMVSLGYLALPWLGAQIFAQYSQTSMSVGESEGPGDLDVSQVDANGGQVGLFGGEIRLRTYGPTYGAWGSLGLAFGGAELTLEADGLGEPIEYQVDFGPTPVAAFGVEAKLVDAVRVGLEARWYLVTVQRACETREGGFSLIEGDDVPDRPPDDGYYYYGPPPTPDTVSGPRERVCTDSTEGEHVPDAVYLGVSMTIFLN